MSAPLPGAACQALRCVIPGLPLGFEEPDSRRSVSARALALAVQDPRLASTAQGMAAWTWQREPWDAASCRLLLEADRRLPFLPEAARGLVAGLDALLALPFPEEAWQVVRDAGEPAQALRRLLPRLRAKDGPAWLLRAWDWLLRLGRTDLPRDMLEATAFEPALAPLRQRLLAEWAFFYAPPGEALERIEALAPESFGLWQDLAACETLLALGRRPEALARLARLWRALPWHPNLTLKLHALAAPTPLAREAADTCVLLYSWNKRDLLRQTLAGLAASDLGGARVLVLDNGSEDGSGEMLEQARALFPEGRLESVRLPVNVGAPGARNWLLALPATRASRFAVFLDDDVVLSRDWLLRLRGAALAHPWAGVVGCRIVSASAPACLQSADYNLLPGQGPVESFPGFAENIHLFDNMGAGLDLGLFSYVRRTLSVSGCCHLLRVDTLDSVGGFDLRLSPTQFDDLERDIRANLADVPVLYAGTLAVRHVQHSSLARARTAAAVGQVLGNKVKLECLYEARQVAQLAENGLERLWQDLRGKEKELRGLKA